MKREVATAFTLPHANIPYLEIRVRVTLMIYFARNIYSPLYLSYISFNIMVRIFVVDQDNGERQGG